MRHGQAGAAGKHGAGARGDSRPRAAIYSRVSSTRQSLDGELDRQQATIEAHCAAKGYRVTGTYRDVGSGLNDGRRGLLQLLKDVARGKHDVVAISYQDRLSRFGITVIKEFLASWGVRFGSHAPGRGGWHAPRRAHHRLDRHLVLVHGAAVPHPARARGWRPRGV